MKINFYDDYSDAAHPQILKCVVAGGNDRQLGYGLDHYCRLAGERIIQAFGLKDADIHFVPNGTLANVISLSSMLKSYEGVISPRSGHINVHESGALEAVGHKIICPDTDHGKLTADNIDEALSTYEDEHTVLPRVVYLTQATELGTVYSREELQQVVSHAKNKGLHIYLDGARLAMALGDSFSTAELGALDIDIFSIGGTKAGGLYGEALAVRGGLRHNFRHYVKQRGGLMAKSRYIGQQFARFFDDGLWLKLGQQANVKAQQLYSGFRQAGVRFALPIETNQIFPIMKNAQIEALEKRFGFYRWEALDGEESKIRLVCSWATSDEDIDAFIKAVRDSDKI